MRFRHYPYNTLYYWVGQTELPIMAKMRKLPKSQCPQSNDPDFWDVWTGNKKRDIEWEKIANEWQKKK